MTGVTAARLLRLYPRWWRARYGEEFLDLVGPGRIPFATAINIVAGAMDARLSRAHAAADEAQVAAPKGDTMVIQVLRASCRRAPGVSTRDAFIGAGVMLATSAAAALLGIALDRAGYEQTSQFLLAAGFPLSLLASMPFTYLKGQPWRAQVVVIGMPALVVSAIVWTSVLLA